jgi:hypothetical protein
MERCLDVAAACLLDDVAGIFPEQSLQLRALWFKERDAAERVRLAVSEVRLFG